jgi:hypothetical protein
MVELEHGDVATVGGGRSTCGMHDELNALAPADAG